MQFSSMNPHRQSKALTPQELQKRMAGIGRDDPDRHSLEESKASDQGRPNEANAKPVAKPGQPPVDVDQTPIVIDHDTTQSGAIQFESGK